MTMTLTTLAIWLRTAACVAAVMLSVLWCTGCTTTGVVLGAAGIATDTSVTWEIVKHLHAKATEGDDVPCARLDSVQRALNVRCAPFEPGSVRVADLRRPALQGCVLAVAVREPRFWPALPEFIAKGASPESCARSPLVDLAEAGPTAPFDHAAPAVLQALRWLAETDARAVQHDVVRLFSSPAARRAGLDAVLHGWLAQGALDAAGLPFGALGALHPAYLATPFTQALEAQGHTARAALGEVGGVQPRGFELALRESDWAALDWWLARAPELANRVPPAAAGQIGWLPLARVLTPGFLASPASQRDTVVFLMARGADPWRKLPHDPGRSVVGHARALQSPLLPLLEAATSPAPTLLAASARAAL